MKAESGFKNSVLRIPEVAEILRCSVKGVRRLIWNGRLEAFRLGRELRVRADALESYQRRAIAEFQLEYPLDEDFFDEM